MNPTSNSESFSPSFTTNYMDNNILTTSSQSNLQDMLPLPQTVHDSSVSNMQMQYQPPQQFQTLVNSAQTSNVLPVHPTSFFYRPLNDFRHYYINCKEISYNT